MKKRTFPENVDRFPTRVNRERSIAELPKSPSPCWCAGQIKKLDCIDNSWFALLEDESGTMIIALLDWEKTKYATLIEAMHVGDYISVYGLMSNGTFIVRDLRLLATSELGLMPEKKNLREIVLIRNKAMTAIRRFFNQRNFTEIDTPSFAYCPNLELHLDPFSTIFHSEEGTQVPLFLPSSPEYSLKRLLAAGFEKIYAIASCFRNGEYTALHHPEFTMIEWYRAYASYEEIMEDCEELGYYLHRELNGSDTLVYNQNTIDMRPPWDRLSMAEAFEKYAGLTVDEWDDLPRLYEKLGRKPELADGAEMDWEDIFLAVFLDKVEPNLGLGKPLLLYDFPAPLAALSKLKADNSSIAERVELYIEGIELANGYTELNDPDEQRERLLIDQDRKRELTGTVYPIDESFVETLRFGFPPAGGIALGFDRFLMLLQNYSHIAEVLPFHLDPSKLKIKTD